MRYVTKPTALIFMAIISLFVGITLLAAQTDPTPTPAEPTATPAPVSLTCNPDELRQKQAELTALLQTFNLDTDEQAGVTLDNLFKVGEAYQQLALDCGYIPADAASRTVGNDVQRILNTLDRVTGDPLNGQVLYNSELACASCHETGAGVVAPHTEGTFTRIEETRLQDPQLAGYTPEQYIVESIVQPGAYIVPHYNPAMPPYFGQTLTLQQLADLIAFLESQDGPSPE
jgi:mono/diheme cytochrome c family protein